jgi:Kef-type K+ transport system membrane component KefB
MALAMTTTELFLVAMLLIYAVPFLLWRLLKLDVVAPLVVVQIVCGILLGPGVLGVVFPTFHAVVFSPAVIAPLNGIAWWGVMIFVFLAGVELDLAEAWDKRRDTVVTSGLALLVPLLAGCVAALGLLQFSQNWIGSTGDALQTILGLGMACAVTALPILVLLLEKLDVLRTAFGQRVLRYASLDDVVIWSVLALILLDYERLGRQALFLVVFALACVAVRKVLPRMAEKRWFVCLIWLALAGLGADWSGLHFMVGAFLAGLIIDVRWLSLQQLDTYRGVVLGVLMPVFFLSTGLRTTWDLGGVAVIAAALVLLVASVVGKLAGVALAGRLLGWPKDEAMVIGWLLQTKALIMIVFANILLDKDIISSDSFTALLLMAVMSTVLTVPVVRKPLAALRSRENWS